MASKSISNRPLGSRFRPKGIATNSSGRSESEVITPPLVDLDTPQRGRPMHHPTVTPSMQLAGMTGNRQRSGVLDPRHRNVGGGACHAWQCKYVFQIESVEGLDVMCHDLQQ